MRKRYCGILPREIETTLAIERSRGDAHDFRLLKLIPTRAALDRRNNKASAKSRVTLPRLKFLAIESAR
jgi:hypothetical protein